MKKKYDNNDETNGSTFENGPLPEGFKWFKLNFITICGVIFINIKPLNNHTYTMIYIYTYAGNYHAVHPKIHRAAAVVIPYTRVGFIFTTTGGDGVVVCENHKPTHIRYNHKTIVAADLYRWFMYKWNCVWYIVRLNGNTLTGMYV